MNQNRFIPVMLVCMFLTTSMSATDAAYRILCVTGDVQSQSGASPAWKPVRTNQELSKESTVKIGVKGGYCCLLDANGVPLELRETGTTVLMTLTPSRPSSTLNEISSYLVKSFNASTRKQRYVGSVYRSSDDRRSSIVFPYDTRLLDSTVRLVWKRDGSTHDYALTILDATKSELLRTQLTDTSYSLTMTTLKNVRRGDCIYWNAQSSSRKNLQQKPCALCWVSVTEADSIRKEDAKFRQQVRGDLDPSKSPIAAMLIGAWFEKQGFFAEALKYYEKAESLVPAATTFRAAKTALLARLGM